MKVVKIVNMFIPKRNTFTRPGIKMKPTSITIHETGNQNVGANAFAHARLQLNGNRRQASWHIQVDNSDTAYVSIPFNEVAYHAGNREGNYSSIAIEICVNRDGNYRRAVENAIKVVRHIMRKYPHIKTDDIKQHYDWSRKNCPSQLRSGSPMNWKQFLQMIDNDTKKQPTINAPQQHFEHGMKVQLMQTATHYVTGEKMPSWVKGKQYTIQQVKGENILLKELYSWVKNSDVSLAKANTPPKKEWKIGQKVTIKRSALRYSRSPVKIPNRYKGKSYTIQQVGSKDILIKELYSWVRKTDVNTV